MNNDSEMAVGSPEALKCQDAVKLSEEFQAKAGKVLEESGIGEVWKEAGCRVEIVGSMRMRLMASHRDIDLHVYSPQVTEESSFAIAARIAKNPRVKEIKCINGLATDERCVAWHITYEAKDGLPWQFDIIHIIEGSRYDGYFELMADRIVSNATPQQRETILRLKFESEANHANDCAAASEPIHGVEIYEAVIDSNVETVDELRRWVASRRQKPFYYWMPQSDD
ncbi:MAG: phosphoglycerate mutase family protein [Muribaculaceae bacterium]|nr:phosphoglycerate mutase family protein [Muribaculaceae bacterium]